MKKKLKKIKLILLIFTSIFLSPFLNSPYISNTKNPLNDEDNKPLQAATLNDEINSIFTWNSSLSKLYNSSYKSLSLDSLVGLRFDIEVNTTIDIPVNFTINYPEVVHPNETSRIVVGDGVVISNTGGTGGGFSSS